MKTCFRLNWAGALQALALLGGIFVAQHVSAQRTALIDQGQLIQTRDNGVVETQLIGTFQMADIGTIHSNQLTLGIVHSNLFVVGNIHSNRVGVTSIHSNLVALDRVTTLALPTGAVHSNYLAVGIVHSNLFVLGRIHSNSLAVGSIHSNLLAIGSVHSNILALVNATARALARGNIHSNHLATGLVHSNVLVLDRIDSVPGGVRHPDVLSRDNSTPVGGLWVFLPMEALVAPRLIITRGQVDSTTTIAWPSLSPGFLLQQNANLSTRSWVTAPQVVDDDGTNRFVTVNSAAGNCFYRLFRP